MLKRLSYTFLAVLGFLILLQYSLLPVFLHHEKVKERIVAAISQETNGTVQFSDLSLRVFPWVSFQMKDLSYHSKNQEEPLNFEAPYLRAGLSLLGLIQKKITLRDLIIKGASISGKTQVFSDQLLPFEFKDLTIDARGIRKSSLGSFRARGRLSSEKNNFEISGSLHLGDLVNFKLNEMLCDLNLKLSQVPIEPLLKERLKFLPLRIINGQVTGSVRVVKKTANRKGDWSADLNFQNILYADPKNPGVSFPPVSQRFESAGSWDVDAGTISIHSSRVLAEGIDGDFTGDFNIADKGLAAFDAHIAFSEFDFEKALRHFPFLTYWFKNGADLKGKGEIRFQAKGTFNSFTLHGEIVLDDVAVEYSYFHKDKGVPLSLVADFKLEDRAAWSGTFDFRYRELKTKGTLLKWVPATQQLSFTLLTNKFHLATFLEATASAKANAVWEGDTKVLLNYQGIAGEPERAKIYGVVNMDNLSYQIKGLPVKTPPLTATFKIENDEITSERSYLMFGDKQADLEVHWKGWENPRIDWNITADTIDLDSLWIKEDPGALKLVSKFKKELLKKMEGTAGLEEEKPSPEMKLLNPNALPPWVRQARALGEIAVKKVIFRGSAFTDVKGTYLMENGAWHLVPLEGRAVSGGSVWLEAEQDLKTEALPEVRIYGKNVPLDQFSGAELPGSIPVEGTISFSLRTVKDPSAENIVRGSFLINRGSLKNVSILGSAGSLFKEAAPSRGTAFNNLGSRFQIGAEGTTFEGFMLDSKELSLKAAGQWLRTGDIQFLAETLLNKDWSEKWKKNISGNERLAFSLTVEGQAADLRAIPDPKSLKAVPERDFLAGISRGFDSFKQLERQSPARFSIPDKMKFLGEVAQSEPQGAPKKAGFFESLFGFRS